MDVELTYANGRGLAEIIRLTLTAAKIKVAFKSNFNINCNDYCFFNERCVTKLCNSIDQSSKN